MAKETQYPGPVRTKPPKPGKPKPGLTARQEDLKVRLTAAYLAVTEGGHEPKDLITTKTPMFIRRMLAEQFSDRYDPVTIARPELCTVESRALLAQGIAEHRAAQAAAA